MAVITRVNIIIEAKKRIGRKGQPLNLVNAYDGITRLMSCKYPLIAHQRASVACVIGQNYLAHTSFTEVNAASVVENIRSIERIQYAAVDLEYLEPELFWTLYSASNGTPTKATHTWIDGTAANAKVWFYVPPDATSTCTIIYSLINPASAAGDSYQHLMTEDLDECLIRGVCWKGCEIIGEFQKALWWKQLFDQELTAKAHEKTKRFQVVHEPEL